MGWRIAWLTPFGILLLLIVIAVMDYRAGSNLWPLLLIYYVPLAVIYYIALGIVRWVVVRRASKQSGNL